MTIEVMKVCRDASGQVINIGVWDYQLRWDAEQQQEVVTNPVPEGATFADEQVAIMPDGSKRVVDP